jgi:hypothetical protein|nr:MAG TPA: hypothetical protein [Caudoviricetes sp.]
MALIVLIEAKLDVNRNLFSKRVSDIILIVNIVFILIRGFLDK